MTEIKAKRGDTIVLNLSVSRDGSPVDLTGSTIWFTAKRLITDADGAAIIRKSTGSGISVTNAAGGEATVTVAPSDTSNLDSSSNLLFDCQVKESDGRISTVASGRLIIEADITRSTS